MGSFLYTIYLETTDYLGVIYKHWHISRPAPHQQPWSRCRQYHLNEVQYTCDPSISTETPQTETYNGSVFLITFQKTLRSHNKCSLNGRLLFQLDLHFWPGQWLTSVKFLILSSFLYKWINLLVYCLSFWSLSPRDKRQSCTWKQI